MGIFLFSHKEQCRNKSDILECLGIEEAQRVLSTVKWRSEELEVWWGKKLKAEIFYGDKWLFLARADAYDQVRTLISPINNDMVFRANPVAYYRNLIRYGAHVTENGFYILDSVTDG